MSSDFSVFERTQATLNELQHCGARAPFHIDLMDTRHMGPKGHRRAPPLNVVYTRHAGAANITWWPLPGYQTLAPTGSVGAYPVDHIPLGQKADKCVWRRNMTGRMMAQLAPDERPLEGVPKIRKRMEATQPDWDKIQADLACVPRYNVVQTYKFHPDF